MSELLHQIDVFRSLATAEPGLARDWANGRLALFSPKDVCYIPAEPMTADLVLATKPDNLSSIVARTLGEARPVSEELASAMTAIPAYGVMPMKRTALTEVLKTSQAHAAKEAIPWLALARALAGDSSVEDIKATSNVDTASSHWILPTLLCLYAEQDNGLNFSQIARELLPRLLKDPQLLPAILETLGTPASSAFLNPFKRIEAAITAGSSWAGARPHDIELGKGSAKKQHQKALLTLLDKENSPAAKLLRGLYEQKEAAHLGLGPIAVASWIHHYSPGNAVFDVLNCSAGNFGDNLSTARALINESHREELTRSLAHPQPVEASVLALELLNSVPDALHLGLLKRIQQPKLRQLRSEVAAIVAYANHSDQIVSMLQTEELLDAGLCLARWVPTVPVLEALLVLTPPDPPEQLNAYALALAGMGDHAAISRLSEITLNDTHVATWCRNLSYALLGSHP